MLDVPIRRRKRSSYRVTTALVGLELCAGKLACTVLRGLGAGNRPWLLDFLSQQVTLTEQRNEALAKTLIFNKVTKNLKILRTSLKKSLKKSRLTGVAGLAAGWDVHRVINISTPGPMGAHSVGTVSTGLKIFIASPYPNGSGLDPQRGASQPRSASKALVGG